MLVALLTGTGAFGSPCPWCVFGAPKVADDLITLARKKPEEILRGVRGTGVCVAVMDSGRKVPPGQFVWSQVEKPKGMLSAFTKKSALLGKTLCKGERDIAMSCDTIILAGDAPKGTLLHEYLHTVQLKNNKNWCRVSKKLWVEGYTPTEDEYQLTHDMEWDVYKTLWSVRTQLKLSLEDLISITSGMSDEAKARSSYDGAAAVFLREQKVAEELGRLVVEYKRSIGIK